MAALVLATWMGPSVVRGLVRLGEPNYDPVLAADPASLAATQVARRYVYDLANGDLSDLRLLSTGARWQLWGQQATAATAAVADGGVDVRLESVRTVVLDETASRALVQVWDRYRLSGTGATDGEWRGVALYTLVRRAGRWLVDRVSAPQGWRLSGGS